MLNMQSANAGSIPGVGGGIPAPIGQDIGGSKDLGNSKTNSETVAIVDTNHEGMIVSNHKYISTNSYQSNIYIFNV